MMKNLKEAHYQNFNSPPSLISKAPGRINLIGEHTDYNLGYVLPASIDKYMYFTFSKNKDNEIRLYTADLDDNYSTPLSAITLSNKNWANYILGVIQTLQLEGYEIGGIDCCFGGDIPIGAGVSSSSALECAFIYGLNELYRLNIDRMQMAKYCQQADHEFLGVKGGIMDQFTSLYGKVNQAILLDCRSMKYTYHNVELKDYSFLLINTNVKHSHIDGEYNNRPRECKEALSILKKQYPSLESIRDVTLEILNNQKGALSDTLFDRIEFVINENERVLKFCEAMKMGNLSTMGTLLNQSHKGLSLKYEVSCTELDFLAAEAQLLVSVMGARMMGGGFGGCTINLVKTLNIPSIKEIIRSKYFEKFNITPDFYECKIEEGASIIEKI